MWHTLKSWTQPGTGHDSALWPVLLLLLVVLVPSAGVVWMMRAAMENERLAVRQKLGDAYRVQLESARRRIDQQWRETLERLGITVVHLTPRKLRESLEQQAAVVRTALMASSDRDPAAYVVVLPR